jgi:uncharacterized membrane protein SpoIIM required for sporulation
MAAALLPHGLLELGPFALPLRTYSAAHRRPPSPRRVADVTVTSGVLLLAAAALETYG